MRDQPPAAPHLLLAPRPLPQALLHLHRLAVALPGVSAAQMHTSFLRREEEP